MKVIGDMPLSIREPLINLLLSELSPPEFNAALSEFGTDIDLSNYRREIAEALIETSGICDVVPEVYKDFRPIVYDGAMFIFSRISEARLLRIINAQILIDTDTSSQGGRLVKLVEDIPMLYKLGQIIARNPNIEEAFRKWLTLLEGGLIHTDIATINSIIESELGDALKIHAVELSEHVLSEASVSAVAAFTWHDSVSGGTGVFKVVKPGVAGFLTEDMKLLDELAAVYTENSDKYALGDFQFTGTLKDVNHALSKEIDLRNEQVHMKLAREFYRTNRRIKVPRPLPFLSTNQVTAMEFIDGEKITGARGRHRAACAVELFNAVVCSCLFSGEERSIFHADPHAGNIFIIKDGAAGFRIALIDWSQTGTLTKAARASVLRLAAGIATNNRRTIAEAAAALSEGDTDETERTVIENEIDKSPAGVPFIEGALDLLDRLAIRGMKFPADLLLFRKALFTLNGVALSLDTEFDADTCFINYMVMVLAEEAPQRWFNMFFLPYTDSPYHYRSLMSNAELFTLICERAFLPSL